MPRTPKHEDGEEYELDEVAAAEAVAEVHEDLAVEEAAAAFFAAQAKSGEGEEGEGSVEQIEAEPVLGVADGEGDGGSDDSLPEEAAADEGSPEEERAEPTVEEAVEEVVEPDPEVPEVDTRTAAERRPTTGGGLTIVTQ